MLIEVDGRNTRFLKEECQFSEWFPQYYGARLLAESLEPGLPKDSPDKALALWSAHLSGTSKSKPLEKIQGANGYRFDREYGS